MRILQDIPIAKPRKLCYTAGNCKKEGKTVLVASICAIACVLLLLSVCFKPTVKIGKHTPSIYWLPPLIAAVILLASGKLSVAETMAGLTADTAMNPLKILVLFLCMTLLSVFLDATGFFSLLAAAVLRRAKFSQKRLFIYLYLIVSLLTVFTSNDVVVLTFTPFICYFAANANIKPLPYLLCAFVAANTFSLTLVIGNPTNMYLAANVGFLSYLCTMLLPTVFAGVTAFAMLYLLFRKDLSATIGQGYPQFQVRDPLLLAVGVIHLSVCIALLILSGYIALPMWKIALGAFCSLLLTVCICQLIRRRSLKILWHTCRRAPFDTVPFVLSMFILVLALQKYGFTDKLAALLNGGHPILTYGLGSFIAANLINNIPMSVLFATIIENPAALYATVIGSNIGAYCTPLGALAGIMFKSQLQNHAIKLSFGQFVRYGAVIAVPTLFAALLGLLCVT